MKRISLLNTSIMTVRDACYKYKSATIADCRQLMATAMAEGTEIISAIGHESTAEIMIGLLNYPVKVNRIQYQQAEEDIAIVFKMNGRPLEGKILTSVEIEEIGYSFGIIRRIDFVEKMGVKI